MHLLLRSMTLVHQNSSLLSSSSSQSSVRLLPTSVLCHHPTKFFSLSSRNYYYYKVAQKSISRNKILSLSNRTTSSMRNGINRNGDKDKHTTGEYLLFFTLCYT